MIDKLRLWPWLGLAVASTAVVGVLAPHQLGVLVWTLSKISLAAWLGYRIHRSLERGPRPHELEGATRDAALLRRALIVGAVVVAIGLGV